MGAAHGSEDAPLPLDQGHRVLIDSGFFLAFWALVIGYQASKGFPYRDWVGYLFVTVALLGLGLLFCYMGIRMIRADYPNRLRVSRDGFASDFPDGHSEIRSWRDPATWVELVDSTDSPFHLSSSPGIYLTVPSRGGDTWWIPEEADLALMDSARAAGADVSSTDASRDPRIGHGRPGPQVETIRIRGARPP